MRKLAKIGLVLLTILLAIPKSHAQISVGISISANIAPPALPVYVQPDCPTDGYLWVPGYWAYDPDAQDYYWVPGVWVAPPQPGYLWTPAYWGYEGGAYGFHPGYWGAHVGFYGGINYGYGYAGVGFIGGSWSGNVFRYNTAVVHVNTTVVHNTYIDRTVIVNNNYTVNNRTSFNGPGGVTAKPRPEELAAMREPHVQPTSMQQVHERTAHQDKSQFASVNHGRPATAAMNTVHGTRFTPQGEKAAPAPRAAMTPAQANSHMSTVPQHPVSAANANRTAPARNTDMTARPNPTPQTRSQRVVQTKQVHKTTVTRKPAPRPDDKHEQ